MDTLRDKLQLETKADQLRSIYEQLAERLRSSYSLVYRTDRQLPDGTFRWTTPTGRQYTTEPTRYPI